MGSAVEVFRSSSGAVFKLQLSPREVLRFDHGNDSIADAARLLSRASGISAQAQGSGPAPSTPVDRVVEGLLLGDPTTPSTQPSAAFTSPDWRINLRGGHATIGTSDDPGVYGPRKLVTVTDRPDLAVLDGTDPLPVVEVGQELYALLILNSNGDVLSYVGDVAATGTGQAPSNATVASRGPGAFITLGVLRWIRTDDASFTQEQLYWRRDW